MLIETTKVAKYKHRIMKNANPSMSDWSVTPRGQFFAKLYFFKRILQLADTKSTDLYIYIFFFYDTSKTGGTDTRAPQNIRQKE